MSHQSPLHGATCFHRTHRRGYDSCSHSVSASHSVCPHGRRTPRSSSMSTRPPAADPSIHRSTVSLMRVAAYCESIGDPSATPGERGDSFFSLSQSAGAQAMLTVPMIGWVGKVGTGRSKLAGFSIARYGPQTANDWQWFPDAGNGISAATGRPITGNDPNDANVPADAVFQRGWVQHLVSTWGTASAGGLAYYILDNEPSIWHGTHRDVHPTGATMDEIKDQVV